MAKKRIPKRDFSIIFLTCHVVESSINSDICHTFPTEIGLTSFKESINT